MTMNDEQWVATPSDLGSLSKLRRIERLRTAEMRPLTALTVARILPSLRWTQGWYTRLCPTGSMVATIGEETIPSDFLCTAAEGIDANGVRFRVGPTGDGNYAIWAFEVEGANDAEAHWPPEGFEPSSSMTGLVVERRTFLSVRDALGDIAYDVYWSATQDDGMQPRLSLFARFLS